MSSAGFAQTATKTAAAAEATDTGISDIIVTATRQAQNLQSVPVAVSAFTAKALEAQQITNTSKLIQSIPNTTFTKGNFTGTNLAIRGIGTNVVATSGDNGVGVHINDMPLVTPRLFETEFYDIQRIEVLRGPQGTLYGRNATAGVLNVITNKADPKGLQAFGEFEYGNYNSVKVTGMVNVPVNDKIAVRLAGLYVNRDGYITNLYNDTQIDGRNSYAFRGSIHWDATENLTIDLMGSYFKESSDRMRIQAQRCINDPTGVLGCQPNGLAAQHTNGNATLAAILTSKEFLTVNRFGALAGPLSLGSIYGDNAFTGAIVPSDPFQTATQYTPTYDSNELVTMANVEYRFDKGTLSLIGGYSQNMIDSREDYSLTVDAPADYSGQIATLNAVFPGKAAMLFQGKNLCMSQGDPSFLGYVGGKINSCHPNQAQYDISDAYTHQWSGEAHYTSHLDGKFNFLVGGIYLNYQNQGDYYVVASGLDYASLILTGATTIGGKATGLTSPFYDNRTEKYNLSAWALFGEAYYQFNDQLKLTLGARYTQDKKTSTDVVPQPLYNLGATAAGATTTAKPVTYLTQKTDNNALTGRVLLQWTPTLDWTDSTMVYASYSRGYKAGGINPSFDPSVVAGVSTTFGPEHIDAFEIGWKNRALGGTLQANLTGFYYNYQGLQVSRIVARSSFNDNTNAEVYGVEAEFVIQPVQALQFNMNLSWLHTALKSTSLSDSRDPSGGRSDSIIIKDVTNAANCVVTPTTPGGPRADALVNAVNASLGLRGVTPIGGTNTVGAYSICSVLAGQIKAGGLPYQYIQNANGTVNLPDGNAVDLTGRQLAQSPEWKFAVGAQYNFDLSTTMNGFLRADYNYTGNMYGRIYNDFADRIPGYGVFNAQAQINGGDGRWYVRAFVQNIFNTQAATGMYLTDASSGLFTNVFTVDPRRYGAAIGFHY
jgi:outer membrane receptor protein involved in Fe transport